MNSYTFIRYSRHIIQDKEEEKYNRGKLKNLSYVLAAIALNYTPFKMFLVNSQRIGGKSWRGCSLSRYRSS